MMMYTPMPTLNNPPPIQGNGAYYNACGRSHIQASRDAPKGGMAPTAMSMGPLSPWLDRWSTRIQCHTSYGQGRIQLLSENKLIKLLGLATSKTCTRTALVEPDRAELC